MNRNPALRLLLFCLLALSANAAEKLKVLVITGGHGFDTNSFFQVFKDNPQISFTPAAHKKTTATVYERSDLLEYDTLVLYDMQKTITDAQKEKFLAVFDRGIG